MIASSISITSFATLVGAPPGILGAKCGLTFSIATGFIKNNKK